MVIENDLDYIFYERLRKNIAEFENLIRVSSLPERGPLDEKAAIEVLREQVLLQKEMIVKYIRVVELNSQCMEYLIKIEDELSRQRRTIRLLRKKKKTGGK